MAFAPVKLILLAVLLVQVASVIAVPANRANDYYDYYFHLGDGFGAPAAAYNDLDPGVRAFPTVKF